MGSDGERRGESRTNRRCELGSSRSPSPGMHCLLDSLAAQTFSRVISHGSSLELAGLRARPLHSWLGKLLSGGPYHLLSFRATCTLTQVGCVSPQLAAGENVSPRPLGFPWTRVLAIGLRSFYARSTTQRKHHPPQSACATPSGGKKSPTPTSFPYARRCGKFP